MLKWRSIVLGGARSGKSGFAETLVNNTGLSKIYLATAQAFDDEMRLRIEKHVSNRRGDWETVEAPLDVASALRSARPGSIILLDCATLWLSNQMLAGNDLAKACSDLIAAVDDCAADLVIVSNEVGAGIVPENALGRDFRDAQGVLNQKLAAICDLAVLVIAGMPLVLKGTLPERAQ